MMEYEEYLRELIRLVVSEAKRKSELEEFSGCAGIAGPQLPFEMSAKPVKKLIRKKKKKSKKI